MRLSSNNCYHVHVFAGSTTPLYHLFPLAVKRTWKRIKIECINQTYQYIKSVMKPNGKPSGFQLTRALSITVDLIIFLLGKMIGLRWAATLQVTRLCFIFQLQLLSFLLSFTLKM